MGLFCANIVLSKPAHEQAVAHLREAGLNAFVARDTAIAVVAEERLDEQDNAWMGTLVAQLSQRCSCAALGAIVHDSDILMLALAKNGQVVDTYHSCPGYFDEAASDDDFRPSGGDALQLAEAFGVESNLREIAEVLSTGGPASEDADGYAFEDDRFSDLCDTLGIPPWAALFCYTAAERDEFPEGLLVSNVERV